VQFTAWVRWRGKEGELIDRLAPCEWPVPVILCAVRPDDGVWLPRLRALAGSQTVNASRASASAAASRNVDISCVS